MQGMHVPGITSDEAVEVLRDAKALISRLAADLAKVQADHTADLATISSVLMREAEDRDWCEDYDDIVDEINGKLIGGVKLTERPAE